MGRNIAISVGEYYHVYNRGTDKRDVFIDEQDWERFNSLLCLGNSTKRLHLIDMREARQEDMLLPAKHGGGVCEQIVAIGAYSLMSNHFHLLIKETEENGISKFMQKVSTAYTMYFNEKYKRSGALFQGRFKARHVDGDEYLKYLYAYIHLNPVAIIDPKWKESGVNNMAAAEKFLQSYQYSSYQSYGGFDSRNDRILNKSVFPGYFETEDDFKSLVRFWLEGKKNLFVVEKF